MFRRPLPPSAAYWFEMNVKGRLENSIHMLFVSFPLDVIWLDENFKIVDIQRAEPFDLFNPTSWRLYIPAAPAIFVLEAPAGVARRLKLKKGTKLKLV